MKKELYVVGLIPDPVRNRIFEYQKKLSALYGLYKNKYPELHVTLARLEYEDQGQIAQFSINLGAILSNIPPQTVEIQGISCFGPPFKSVNLHVNTTAGLKKLTELIINTAMQTGLTGHYPFDTWQYHITVASPVFAMREWSESEYEQACKLLESQEICTSFVMDHIQLWHPVMEDYVINTYILKKTT